jgi:plasmid stabilization system protein ParE
VSRKVTFHPLAKKELRDSARYYESVSADLAREFVNEIDRCVQCIVRHPRAGLVLKDELRRWLAHAFPFAVLYSIKPSRIRMLAVMHLKRRPTYWVARK